MHKVDSFGMTLNILITKGQAAEITQDQAIIEEIYLGIYWPDVDMAA